MSNAGYCTAYVIQWDKPPFLDGIWRARLVGNGLPNQGVGSYMQTERLFSTVPDHILNQIIPTTESFVFHKYLQSWPSKIGDGIHNFFD
jgi:hypothetical protein